MVVVVLVGDVVIIDGRADPRGSTEEEEEAAIEKGSCDIRSD